MAQNSLCAEVLLSATLWTLNKFSSTPDIPSHGWK